VDADRLLPHRKRISAWFLVVDPLIIFARTRSADEAAQKKTAQVNAFA
jgi:hypothetical protein